MAYSNYKFPCLCGNCPRQLSRGNVNHHGFRQVQTLRYPSPPFLHHLGCDFLVHGVGPDLQLVQELLECKSTRSDSNKQLLIDFVGELVWSGHRSNSIYMLSDIIRHGAFHIFSLDRVRENPKDDFLYLFN